MYQFDTNALIRTRWAKKAKQDTVLAKGLSPKARKLISLSSRSVYSPTIIVGLTQAAEVLLVTLLGFVMYYGLGGQGRASLYYPAIVAVGVLYTFLAKLLKAHTISAYRTLGNQALRVVVAWAIALIFCLAANAVLQLENLLTGKWFTIWTWSVLASILTLRLVLRGFVLMWTAQEKLTRRTIIVGGGEPAEKLIREIESSSDSDIKILGLFDDRDDERSPAMVAAYPKLGSIKDLTNFARLAPIDLLLISLPMSAEKRVVQLMKDLWVLPIDIRLSSHMSELKFHKRAYSYIGSVAVLDLMDRPITDWNLVSKWFFDRIIGFLALVGLLPVMALVALAVKLDSPGPIIFRQKRHGFNNKEIDVLKFRSMYAHMTDHEAKKQTTRDDPRVTRVGRFIRKTSLDELPQLFNVLFGQLSLVGPRPHAVKGYMKDTPFHEAVEGYFARHRVMPGITGWAQINGLRGETDTQEKIMARVEYDLHYIENWSIWFDLYILARTPFALIQKNENAF